MPLTPANGFRLCRVVAGASLLTFAGSGCITISPGSTSFSLKSLTKPDIQRASYERTVEEAPRDPKNPAQLKLAYAMLMEEAGKLEEARKHYAEVADMQPKNADACLGLARLDQKQGNLDAAGENFRKAVRLAPDSAAAQHGLGQFYAGRGDWKAASEALNKAMLAAPDNSEYRYHLAVSLVHLGDVDAALPHFIRTIGDAEAHYNVGLILQQNDQLEEAERQFQIALTKKPDLQAAQRWLVHLRQHRQQPAADPNSRDVIPAGHSAAAASEQQTVPTDSARAVAPEPSLSAQHPLEADHSSSAASGS